MTTASSSLHDTIFYATKDIPPFPAMNVLKYNALMEIVKYHKGQKIGKWLPFEK